MGIEVNGELISNAEIRAAVAQLREEREQAGVEASLEDRMALRDEAIRALVERTLLLQEARRLELAPSAEEVQQLAESLAPRGDGVSGCRAGVDMEDLRRAAERRLTIDALLGLWCAKVSPPPPAAVSRLYRENRERFALPESVWASHIVRNYDGENRTEQRERVERLRERLIAGEDFATLASAESDCPENGGDLGWITRGTMVEEFDDVVFAATPGVLTDVFETRFGAHVAIVRDRREAGIPPFEDVADMIGEQMHHAKMDREAERQAEALLRRASIREVA
jgi:parvulin-like peptidyl-prolyl isomerase